MVIADLHSGSVYGLTPPRFFTPHYKSIQAEAWKSYLKIVDKWKRPDILIVNGDAIEGNQTKQGGAELITPDRNVQCQMAKESISVWEAKEVYMTYGTKYHVSDQAEDFEYAIADDLGATIEGRLFLKINGVTFDIRHKIGSSIVPYGRSTAIRRELAWDLIKEAQGTGPKVNVVVRSHAHYHEYSGRKGQLAVITPCLQLARGRYGSRECSGDIDWGALQFTIENNGDFQWESEICALHANRPRVIKIK